MDQLWEAVEVYAPLVLEKLEVARFVFSNPDAAEPRDWKATGDWVADMRTAYEAAWSGTVHKVNNTHHVFKTRGGGECFFQSTYQLLPELEPTPLYPFRETEGVFDGSPLSAYMREYFQIPLILVALYVVVIFSGRAVMSCLPAADLTVPLALWNLALSLFSWVGVFRTVPHLLGTIAHRGVYFSMCEPVCATFGASEVGLWAWLFIISKIPELIDTVFIVLRKKPLIFLHWYHHVTVLLYCWASYTTQNSAGLYFICMNYTVHAIMYGYYFLKAVNMWPRFIPSWTITLLQLSQMVGGIVVCYLTYKYEKEDGLPCSISEVAFNTGVVMYGSYFLLFLQILFSLLSGGKKKSAGRPKADAGLQQKKKQ